MLRLQKAKKRGLHISTPVLKGACKSYRIKQAYELFVINISQCNIKGKESQIDQSYKQCMHLHANYRYHTFFLFF